MTHRPLPPGSTLGVFGGGQLGRMFAQAAARMGYQVHVFAPELDPPAADVARVHTRAPYEDLDAVRDFASRVHAVTYEFENVPAETVAAIAEYVPVRPQPEMLAITRNRLREKNFLQRHGLPVTPFAIARSESELTEVLTQFDSPSVIKTTECGYDGKGQIVAEQASAAPHAWQTLGRPPEVIVEERVDLAGECSMIVARSASGETVCYGPFHNVHQDHILDVSVWTADDPTPLARAARELTIATADALELDGLICVELFIAQGGALLVNEIAPRPHNSGHLTIEACSISQFEQQVRLTAGWPPATPGARASAAAMANLLGDLWSNGEPDWGALLKESDIALHLYGKKEARPGRKMGHLTALAPDAKTAEAKVRAARARLGFSHSPDEAR